MDPKNAANSNETEEDNNNEEVYDPNRPACPSQYVAPIDPKDGHMSTRFVVKNPANDQWEVYDY